MLSRSSPDFIENRYNIKRSRDTGTRGLKSTAIRLVFVLQSFAAAPWRTFHPSAFSSSLHFYFARLKHLFTDESRDDTRDSD